MSFPTGYDNALSIELAHLSEAAYQQLSAFNSGKPWKPPSGYTLKATLTAVYESGNPPIGFIASKRKALYIAWRGTDDAIEWLEDAKFDQIQCSFLSKGKLVELGFHELYTTGSHSIASPQATVVDYLNGNAGKFSAVYVTGHSLGAALAVLNAANIATSTPYKSPIMYSFAGPRVGDRSFASSYNNLVETSWRVVNTNDEVPKVPFTGMGKGYKHVNGEVPIRFGSGLAWHWGEDHSLVNYISKLESLS